MYGLPYPLSKIQCQMKGTFEKNYNLNFIILIIFFRTTILRYRFFIIFNLNFFTKSTKFFRLHIVIKCYENR